MNNSLTYLSDVAALESQEEGEKKVFPAPISLGRSHSTSSIDMPLLSHQTSLGDSITKLKRNTSLSNKAIDWRLFLTIEDRISVRERIRDAYINSCKTFDELLDTCCAIDEELLHISAPSKLDYFKSGMRYKKRLIDKQKQLTGQKEILGELDERKDYSDNNIDKENGTGKKKRKRK